MPNSAFKPRLIELLLQMHARQQELVRDLSDEQRDASGTPEHWSAKDLIAHITAWEQRQVISLEAMARAENPPRFDDLDRLNAQTFEEQHQCFWLEVLDEAERAADWSKQDSDLNSLRQNPDYRALLRINVT